MRVMKNSGIEWIGEIPNSWSTARISGLYTVRREKVSDKDYPPLSVTMQGIVPQLETAAKTNDGDNRKLVRKGDFAINSRSDRRGSCGISSYDGSVSLINTVLVPLEEMNPQYYNWLFHTVQFADEYVMLIPDAQKVYPPFYKWFFKSSQYINAIQSTTNLVRDGQAMRYANFVKVPLFIIPMDEQREIADYLNETVKKVDALLNSRQKQVDVLEGYRKAVIFEYVTGKKEVPA